MFKRRNPKPFGLKILHALWPQGGWSRAITYMRHRISRLPASPEQIGRGIFAGVFAAFTPFYGFHFIFAILLAWILRGHVLAAAFATLFGNPLTYVPIGVVCLQVGYFLLGRDIGDTGKGDLIISSFGQAGTDLWQNTMALFTHVDSDWNGLATFWQEVFFPYLIGGIIPGMIAGIACYWICVPLIRAYKARRQQKVAKRRAMDALKRVKQRKPAAIQNPTAPL